LSHKVSKNSKVVIHPDQAIILRYESEDDQQFLVSDPNGFRLAFFKNRAVPQPFIDKPAKPFTPVFRLLTLAFVGIAPAGIGTVLFAPLAVVWSLSILITRPLSREDRIRMLIAWGITILMLGIAIPLNILFMTRVTHR
jgi:hypothetical protein